METSRGLRDALIETYPLTECDMKPISTASRILFAVLPIIVSTCLSACGSGSGHSSGGATGGVSVSFAGPWEGTWSTQNPGLSGVNTTVTGTLTLQLDQIAAGVTGTGSFAGHPCLAACTVSCQVDGHDMSGWFDAGAVQMMFAGYCSESSHCSGDHHANTLTASYEIQDGPCAGESGVMQLAPVAAYEGDASEPGPVYIGEVIILDPTDGDVLRLPVFERP